MAIDAYPVGSDSGFSEESAINSERDRLIAALGGRMSNFIVDPFNSFGNGSHFGESHSGSSLDITIDPSGVGKAFMGGHLVVNDAAITITLNASSTNEIFLVVRDSATGNAEVVYTSDGTTPSGMYVMKIWEAVTDTSGVTSTTDFRRYIPFEDDNAGDNITGRKSGMSGTISIASTGVKVVSVAFTNDYVVQIDTALATLNSLTDTAANLGWIRTKNLTTSGFDIEAKVTKSGGSGTTADFNWNAYGK